MDGKNYLEMIAQRLARYYDEKNTSEEKLTFDFAAELHAADEGYFLIPSIKTYSVQHHEYFYAKIFHESLCQNAIAPYLALLRERMQGLAVTSEHMSSLFVLLCVCETAPDEKILEEVTSYKYHKDYCFSLKGWSDLALVVADAAQEKIYANKAGRKILKYFAF